MSNIYFSDYALPSKWLESNAVDTLPNRTFSQRLSMSITHNFTSILCFKYSTMLTSICQSFFLLQISIFPLPSSPTAVRRCLFTFILVHFIFILRCFGFVNYSITLGWIEERGRWIWFSSMSWIFIYYREANREHAAQRTAPGFFFVIAFALDSNTKFKYSKRVDATEWLHMANTRTPFAPSSDARQCADWLKRLDPLYSCICSEQRMRHFAFNYSISSSSSSSLTFFSFLFRFHYVAFRRG